MVRIGVLTSSRADFGVYLPLLKAFKKDTEICFEIIAFGTHLSNFHGYTINEIEKNDFEIKYKISSLISDDTENAIATSAALTSLKFADFWTNHKDEFDVVLCLGDRFEMFSAVVAGIPFGIKFAHFYGGDYSQGAIDNVYRDSLTHCSDIHFTSTQECADRVKQMVKNFVSIDVIGILSIEELENMNLLSLDDFFEKWNINIRLPTILGTFHPETIHPENNIQYSKIVFETLAIIQKSFQLVITMPNADTNGIIFRKMFEKLKLDFSKRVHLIENFGLQSYFSCMKHSKLMIGNSSSGISEAASFNKYFISIGNRQKGRRLGPNVISVPFDKKMIVNAIMKTMQLGEYFGENIYKKNEALKLISYRLKSFASSIHTANNDF
jgi:GDP/UDP-N,N'-diacetylbacillosamine 2-epimerase (hydrolysing)